MNTAFYFFLNYAISLKTFDLHKSVFLFLVQGSAPPKPPTYNI